MNSNYLDIPAQVEVEIGDETRLLSLIPSSTTASARKMLANIYLACELNPNNESYTLDCSPTQAVVAGIPADKKGLRVAVFGLSPKEIGALWAVQPYQWLNIGGQFWCFAERLEDIEANIDKKKQLWSCLKVLKEEKR